MDDFWDALRLGSTKVLNSRGTWESGGGRAFGRRVALAAAGLSAAFLLAACTAVDDATSTPEQRAAEQPKRVSTEGAKDEFPNLSEVPDDPKPYTAPEVREQIVTELSADRDKASFTEPAAGGTVMSGQSVTAGAEAGGLSAAPPARLSQLAAIIYFGHGSVELDGGDRNVLNDLVILHEQRGGILRVVGHANSRTRSTTPDKHQSANLEMSLMRANAVSSELMRLGVPADAVSTEAKAGGEPVHQKIVPSGEAGNRRVEIFLEK